MESAEADGAATTRADTTDPNTSATERPRRVRARRAPVALLDLETSSQSSLPVVAHWTLVPRRLPRWTRERSQLEIDTAVA